MMLTAIAAVIAVGIAGTWLLASGPGSSRPSAGQQAQAGMAARPHGRAAGAAGQVRLGPGVGRQPAASHIVPVVAEYFAAINGRNYRAYARLYQRRARPFRTARAFRSGYGSTTDTQATLAGLSPATAGGWAATVTFDSRQDPAGNPAGTTCTSWYVTFYLRKHRATYLIGRPPAGYRASSQPCP